MKTVFGNWKMNGTPGALKEWEAAFSPLPGVQAGLFLPHTLLSAYLPIAIGAQDVSRYEKTGAYTGEISATLAREVGASMALCGHSERRHGLGESDSLVKQKAENALRAGLKVVLCVGETLEIREKGEQNAYVEKQLRDSWPQEEGEVIVAYEPVWAIGTGKTAETADIQAMHQFIKNLALGPNLTILYGGSVTAANASEILSAQGVDGFLVGGASLKADQFKSICEAALK